MTSADDWLKGMKKISDISCISAMKHLTNEQIFRIVHAKLNELVTQRDNIFVQMVRKMFY